MNKESVITTIDGHVSIVDRNTREVLLDQHNAIHPQNMARILARALANEPNSIIYRLALGNGGTFIDAEETVQFNPPNDGSVNGWESRLYSEIYSEIVDNLSSRFGTDPGSAGPSVVRVGGGAVPENDPAGGGIVSTETGIKSNVIITMFINEDEPMGQTQNDSVTDDPIIIFDELGLYSPGKPAVSTKGYSTVNVGDKTSDDVSNLAPNAVLNLSIDIDGVPYTCEITVPGAGSGPSGAITYGDICEGINTASWITSGDDISQHCYVFITDRSGGVYLTIAEKQSYGNLTFESLSSGNGSTINLVCDDAIGNEFFNNLTTGVCANVNFSSQDGSNVGVINDAITPDNERERLLTHIIFNPIMKTRERALEIEYTLTISVAKTTDSNQSIVSN